MKKPVWVLFLLCFLTGPAIASKRISVDVPQPDPVSEAWRWQFFTERDGLASVRVRDIAQSGTAVWLATDRGVSRYDGMVWQTFSEADGLASDDTWSVMAEPNGTVWVGTARGASRFDGQDWQSFTQVDGLPGDVVRDLLVTEDGQVWAATDGGAALLNGQGWKAFTEIDGLAEDRVNGLAAGPDGAVWFATERGASRFDGVSWQSFRRGEGLQGTSVTSVFADRDGALWFAQYGVGLSRYKGGTWVTFNESNGLPDRQVRRTFQTLDGVIWVICRSGLARLVSTSGAVEDRWVAYNRSMLPGLGEPYTAGVDAQGAIWIGGPGSRGVARFDYTGKRLTVFHLNQAGQIGSGNGIGQDRDGALWFGTEQGALRYDGVGWTQVRDLDGPVSGVLTDAKGTVYLMGRDSQGPAVLKVQGMTHQMVRKGLEGESVRTLAHTRDGVLWAGVPGGGLFRWEPGGEFWVRQVPKKGMPFRILAMSASVDGSLWMSGRGKDLSRRSRGGFFQAYNIPGNRAVQALLASKEGSLWMAYGMGGEGVTRLTTEGLTEHYTVLDGLGHNEVHALMEDGEGHIWAGTSAGVARFDGQNWTALKGMSEMEVHALFMARDGAIWMRTADGSAVRYWNDRKGPRTYLTNPQVQVPASGNVNVDWEGRDRWLAGADALEFSWRLDGSAWGPYTEQIRTSLFSLPDGTHTFEIRARDADQADFGTRQAAGNGQ